MPFDIYSTRAQLAAIELLPREYSFLYDTFCTELPPVEDDKAIYDYRKGSRRMAPVVHPGVGGVPMQRDGYETYEVGFCSVAPERIIENNDLLGRSFGERVLGAMTPQERERKMLAKDMTDLKKAIQRRREWMARQVLLTGKEEVFEYTNEGLSKKANRIADYQFSNNYTPGTPWNQVGAKIDYDMRTMFDLAFEGLGYVDIIVMDPASATAMLENSNYIKTFDGLHVDMGKIQTRYKGSGIRFLGWNSDQVEMYSMTGTFVDDDGTVKASIPQGTVICGYRGMLKMYHGPVTQVEREDNAAQHMTYIKKEVPLRYGSIQTNSIKNRLTSMPTVVPENVDGWVLGHVL